jgi:hypothetical protein
MNLQEQVSRIQSMMGVINEDKNYALKIYLQKLIDDTISELREESQDWGLGEMDYVDALDSIEKIEIDRIIRFTRMVIYVNIFVNSPRRDFDNVMFTINYEIQRYIPNSFVQVDDIIDNRTFGPGIDW